MGTISFGESLLILPTLSTFHAFILPASKGRSRSIGDAMHDRMPVIISDRLSGSRICQLEDFRVIRESIAHDVPQQFLNVRRYRVVQGRKGPPRRERCRCFGICGQAHRVNGQWRRLHRSTKKKRQRPKRRQPSTQRTQPSTKRTPRRSRISPCRRARRQQLPSNKVGSRAQWTDN